MGSNEKNKQLDPTNKEFAAALKDFSEYFSREYKNGIIQVEETTNVFKDCLNKQAESMAILTGCPVGQTALKISFDGSVYLCPICHHEKFYLK